jgi:hypothetical protein
MPIFKCALDVKTWRQVFRASVERPNSTCHLWSIVTVFATWQHCFIRAHLLPRSVSNSALPLTHVTALQNTVTVTFVAFDSVIYKTTWISFLRQLNCCYRGHHQGQMHRFPQESSLRPKPLLRVCSLVYNLFPGKTTWVLDSCYFDTERNQKSLKPTGTWMGHPSSDKRDIATRVMQCLFNFMWVCTCKNKSSLKVTLAHISECERC